MKISIITVVYNNEKTIENAITSVLSQQYKDIEYIVIDGNSTDNTKNIIEQYASNIGKFISEPDGGIYDAMNKGIELATGDVIGVLNSDDLYYNDMVIANVAKRFIEKPDLLMVYGDLVYVNAENTDKIVRKWVSKPYSKRFFEYGNVPPHPTLFVRKKVYTQYGLFKIKYKLAADYDFMLRVFKASGFLSDYIPGVMVKMRLGGATNKSFKNILNGNKEILDSWKENSFNAPFFLMPLRFCKRLIQFI
jgi:glycosyltransferase involved in cell wall biosynthesis